MSFLQILTATEQVAAHLRRELVRGKWSGSMPGGDQLAAELGVGRNTVETALQQLESEGLLLAQGHRRRRKIQPPAGEPAAEAVHVVLLLHSSADRQVHYIVELFHELIEAGHTVSIARKTLLDLHMEVPRVASFTNKVKADA